VRAEEGALTLIDQNAAAQLKYSTEQVYTKAEHYKKITIPNHLGRRI
jgi:hypothetical protein